MKIAARRVSSIIIVAVLFILAYQKIGFYYETNDDRIINEILSGAFTGSPEGHAVFLNPLISVPLSFLYRISAGIPWYGFFLVGIQAICYLLVLSEMYRLCNGWYKYFVATAVLGCIFCVNLYFIGHLEFTSEAALVAIMGYVFACFHDNGKWGAIGFCILEAIAFCIRQDAMLMIQPLGFCVLAGLWLWQDGQLRRQRLKQLLIYGGFLIAIAGIGSLVAMPKTNDWKEYKEFNAARAVLYDYYGTPEYEEVAGILKKYGVTEAEYKAYRIGTIGDDMNTECLKELISYMKQKSADMNTIETFKARLYDFYHTDYWGMQKLAFAVWIIGIVFALVEKRFCVLWALLGLRISSMAVKWYLIWKGRFPLRIVLPLFACELLLTVTVCVREWFASGSKLSWKDITICVLCFVLIRGCLASGYQVYRFVKSENEGQKVYMQGMHEIQQYCLGNPSNKYLLDALSMSYYKGSAFDTELFRKRNSIVTGSWYSHSPSVNMCLEKYLADCDGMIFLIVSGNIELNPYPTTVYLAEVLQSEPLEIDRFTVSNGGEYVVYQYEFSENR